MAEMSWEARADRAAARRKKEANSTPDLPGGGMSAQDPTVGHLSATEANQLFAPRPDPRVYIDPLDEIATGIGSPAEPGRQLDSRPSGFGPPSPFARPERVPAGLQLPRRGSGQPDLLLP